MLTEQQYLQQLGQLVAFKSISLDTKENLRALQYVKQLLPNQAHISTFQHNGHHTLIAGNTSSLTPDLGVLCHIDVVSAPDELFTLKQTTTKVTGRGVNDMKYAIPLAIALLHEVIQKQLNLTFSLAITSDEELGGYHGASQLAHTKKWHPRTLLVPDGGDNLEFVSACKGIVQVRISSQGKAAHGSQPWEGKNALPALCKVVSTLSEKYQDANTQPGWNTTMTPTMLHGGSSPNQVCDSAELSLDFRYPEADTETRILEEVHAVCASIDPTLSISTGIRGLPTYTDTKSEKVTQFLEVFQDTFSHSIPITTAYGSTDARHFADTQAAILMIKPRCGGLHANDEWLDIPSTMKFYTALKKYVSNLSKVEI